VKLHPSAAPSLWPTLLALELGTRITINRRPVGAPLVSLDCFVEQITWDMDSNGEAFVTLQASPADPVPYVALGAFRTTLNTATSVGGASLILNAGGGADSANPLAAQLPKGTQLVVGLGTANQETVTLLSVGSTVAGWSTGTVTLSGTLSKAHSAGVTVSEVLPTGVTDPASYDSADAFGKAVFAY
jgi:hypothetical protein